MGWINLTPVTKKHSNAGATAYMRCGKNHAFIYLYLGADLMKKFAYTGPCSVSAGTADELGMVRLLGEKTGLFAFSKMSRGSARIIIPAFDGLEQRDTEGAPCVISKVENGEIILMLPLEAWKPKTAPVKAAPKAPSADTPPRPAASLDIAIYLTKHGHEVKKLSNGTILVDGEVKTIPRVLAMVNTLRVKAMLPPVDAADLII